MGPLHPVVLVGGRSSRFGRDKLREPLAGGEWLVDRAIAALREATGRPVTLIGPCDPEVAARGDAWLDDAHSGQGPAGGLLTALEQLGDVFVLAGDLPRVVPSALAPLIAAASEAPDALVVRVRDEPLVAIYRRALAPRLAARLAAGRRALHDLAAEHERIEVEAPESALVNANTPAVLGAVLIEREGSREGARVGGVWPFEGIDDALELVPLAGRRALDRSGIHLSLEGWRALPLEARRALVDEGARERVSAEAVRAIAARSGQGVRDIEPSGEPDAARAPEALLDALGAQRADVAARWPELHPLARFALLHGMRSAARRGEPERLFEIVRAVLAAE